MPANPERRTQILDAAIAILADTGVGGLTHRQVDSRSGVPAGTTSNYFRTRLALLEAVTAHVADAHWQRVAMLQALVGRQESPGGVPALLTRMVTDPDEHARRVNVARFELFLEGTRRPELQRALADIQAAALQSAGLILEAAGQHPSAEQVGELARLLNGLAFSHTTFTAEQPGAQDPGGLIDRILRAVLG
ncbi:TetR family transcriptional regulator [Mycobacterium sp. NPDC050551]|uniref:TetR/AcrR family transcriptional regulator n=1 Tax=Mycobacterium sp. NPDC050551 TaxID=3155407 RepID=UPI00343DDEB8